MAGLALALVPVAMWRWGDADLVAAVALALFTAWSIATLIAMSLPWLLHYLGKDPAFGSGPLATVIQDLLSVLINSSSLSTCSEHVLGRVAPVSSTAFC